MFSSMLPYAGCNLCIHVICASHLLLIVLVNMCVTVMCETHLSDRNWQSCV